MINIYLCEDEEIQLAYFKKHIQWYLKNSGKDAILVSAQSNPHNTIRDAKKDPDTPSLFFIDVVLNDYSADGFWVVQELMKINNSFQFVFLTAHSELAYKVFDKNFQIIDYIVKTREYFEDRQLSQEAINRFDHVFYRAEKNFSGNEQKFFFKCGGQKIFMDPKDIICIQPHKKEKHNLQVYCTTTQLIVRASLSKLSDQLGNSFLMINRSCIVSIEHIVTIDKDRKIIELDNGIQCRIPKGKYNHICKILERRRGEKC